MVSSVFGVMGEGAAQCVKMSTQASDVMETARNHMLRTNIKNVHVLYARGNCAFVEPVALHTLSDTERLPSKVADPFRKKKIYSN